jgi:hypothetical protein
MTAVLVVLVVLVVLAVSLAGASVRVLREYERGVVFRFGRLVAQKGPGLVLLMPIADRMVRVTLRTITHTIPPQDVITRDNVPARVDAVAYFRVVDADAGSSMNVIGTRGRTGLRRALMGSVSQTIVGSATCPVLAIPSAAARITDDVSGVDAQPLSPFVPGDAIADESARVPSGLIDSEPPRRRSRGPAVLSAPEP